MDAYAGYAAAKKRYLADDGPAGTAILVTGMLDPRLLLEVDAIAVVGQPESEK
jgi:enamine deaminase RidA (YjgF/YER057c/UK114 family)